MGKGRGGKCLIPTKFLDQGPQKKLGVKRNNPEKVKTTKKTNWRICTKKHKINKLALGK